MSTVFDQAPPAMFATVALAAIVNTDDCRDCKSPRHVWNRLHWLYREWSGKCPECHANDIRLDFHQQNADES